MNLPECYKIIDELTSRIEEIIAKGAIIKDTVCLDSYRDVRVQTYQLIRTLFPDAEARIKDINDSIDVAAKRDGPFSVRISFIEQAKAFRRYLISIKDSLRLRETTEVKDTKLDNLKRQVIEKEVESERREKVAETKFYGAAIEIIDRLRDQLKNGKDTKEEIISIKNDIKEIKEAFWKISNNSGHIEKCTSEESQVSDNSSA